MRPGNDTQKTGKAKGDEGRWSPKIKKKVKNETFKTDSMAFIPLSMLPVLATETDSRELE